MFLSLKYRFIFLKTFKTAGTSFEIALSKYASKDDIITPITSSDEMLRSSLGFHGPQNYLVDSEVIKLLDFSNPRLNGYYNHISALEIRALLGDAKFSSFQKVSIVRNPFDMIVSHYFWLMKNHPEKSKNHFKSWLLSKPSSLGWNHRVTHINRKCIVDHMIRFEAFESDICDFAKKFGLPSSLYDEFKMIRSKSHTRPKNATTKEMFDNFQEGKAIIEEIFSEDIAKYGYSCE